MKLAEDFRAIARDALRGRWGSAALVCLLAGLLGAEIFGAPSMRIDLDSSEIAHLRDFFSTGVFLRYSAFLLLGGSIGVDEYADWANLNRNESLARTGKRVPRVYIEDGEITEIIEGLY